MAKMDKKWVVLCSTAVAAVYASGYFTTEAQANKMNIQPQAQVSMQAKTNQSATGSSTNNQTTGGQSSIAPSSNNQTTASTAQTKRIYKDGTFTGMGENRRGSIQVAVTFKNDKISDVEISDFEMHYAETDVDGLPSEVLKIQSAQVDNVSGATYSTQAFSDAVQDAINQAKNA